MFFQLIIYQLIWPLRMCTWLRMCYSQRRHNLPKWHSVRQRSFRLTVLVSSCLPFFVWSICRAGWRKFAITFLLFTNLRAWFWKEWRDFLFSGRDVFFNFSSCALQVCDACGFSILNLHFCCMECGVEICWQCYQQLRQSDKGNWPGIYCKGTHFDFTL